MRSIFVIAVALLLAGAAEAAPKVSIYPGVTAAQVYKALAAAAVEHGWTLEGVDRELGMATIRAGAYDVSVLVQEAEPGATVSINKKQVRAALRGVRGVEDKIGAAITAATGVKGIEKKK